MTKVTPHLMHAPLGISAGRDTTGEGYGYTENKILVKLTFAVSLTGLLSHLGSNICKTLDHSHSDTTQLYHKYIYIHIYIWQDMVKNSKMKK